MTPIQKDVNEITKDRLLDEAEMLFARKGFDAVSVREITSAARCNLAAVNYHFGKKKNLYLEVFRARWLPRAKRIQNHFRKALDTQDAPTPAAIVRSMAQAFLAGPLSDEERCRHHQLMSRELGRPTEAFELVAEEVMRPFFKKLAHMLGPALPEGTSEEDMMLNILSIFAMVFYFNFAREAVCRITGREYDKVFLDRLVDHITLFSLNGLGDTGREGRP